MVGGIRWCSSVSSENTASTAPAAERVWPTIDLLDDTGICVARSPNTVEIPRYSILSFSGVPENDKMEYLGISTVFGERATQIPVSSNKSMVGHTLSAAGAVEAVFSLLTLEHQRIPPTINYDVPDPAIPFDVVPNKARDARVTAVMSNSFGFGGQNASLILTREPA